jgi:hypothetical protein
MEYNLVVELTVWADGFTTEMTGPYDNPITHQLRIEVNSYEFEEVAFEDVVGVAIVD